MAAGSPEPASHDDGAKDRSAESTLIKADLEMDALDAKAASVNGPVRKPGAAVGAAPPATERQSRGGLLGNLFFGDASPIVEKGFKKDYLLQESDLLSIRFAALPGLGV